MTALQIGIRPISAEEMRTLAVDANVNVPIEQTWVWAEFEETFPDRDLIGFFSVLIEGTPVAILSLTRYRYHGFEFLWCKNGPVWLVPETEELERALVSILIDWIQRNRRSVAFLRIHLRFPDARANSPMQIKTYDRTVIVNLHENEPDLMLGFKRRTRTKIRATIKKTPVECFDETAKGSEDFSPYFAVMEETADRQGFVPWPKDVYQNMLRTLKTKHCRLYAARLGDEIVAFTLITISGSEAVYYYSAATDTGRQNEASIQLLYFALLKLGSEGLSTMDLMGVGSDLAPSLNVLTAFKSGFAQDITEVSPAYDVPVSSVRYGLLEVLREGKSKINTLKTRLLQREKHD